MQIAMMKNNKIFSFTMLMAMTAIFSFVFAEKAFADISCQPIYGGGQSCVTTNNIIVNKTVLNPQTNQFVDNLSINDPKYQPGFITTFQISITNAGNNNISRIDVKDIFPQYVSFSSGDGTFDANTNTLTFSLNSLAPNETRAFSIIGRVVNAERIPVAPGSVVCVVNQAIAMNTNSQSQVSQDNSQFCIEKKISGEQAFKGGFPVFPPQTMTVSPSTGPQTSALFSLVSALGAGVFLRMLANRLTKKTDYDTSLTN